MTGRYHPCNTRSTCVVGCKRREMRSSVRPPPRQREELSTPVSTKDTVDRMKLTPAHRGSPARMFKAAGVPLVTSAVLALQLMVATSFSPTPWTTPQQQRRGRSWRGRDYREQHEQQHLLRHCRRPAAFGDLVTRTATGA